MAKTEAVAAKRQRPPSRESVPAKAKGRTGNKKPKTEMEQTLSGAEELRATYMMVTGRAQQLIIDFESFFT